MSVWQSLRSAATLLALAIAVSGCARFNPPQNMNAQLYGPEKSVSSGDQTGRLPIGSGADAKGSSRFGSAVRELSFSSTQCPPPGTSAFLLNATHPRARSRKTRLPPMRYSPGDRFNLLVFESPEFSGDYAVNADGMVILPFTGQVQAVGLTNSELMQRIRNALIRSGIFTRAVLKLSVRPVQYAPINVTVAGAVFYPGRHTINGIKDSDKLARVLEKFGDSPLGRFVPAALQVAGGVRPDADLTNIKVTRNGRTYRLNWSGAIVGRPVDDMPLVEGDHVEVGEAGCFQSALVRPSQITVPGIRVFNSNLSVPAMSNGQSPKEIQSIPYGTRLLQGLVNANCVGGTMTTNARRYAVLISRNPKTRETEVVQRSIEELVRSADRDTINPYLMPDDAIACYDSATTEVKDLATLLQTLLLPAQSVQSMILAR